MAYASHLYRDPMEIVAGRQAREQRKPKPESVRERIQNSPLTDFPRRWLDAAAPAPWSHARQAAEALFRGEMLPESPSVARRAAEELFDPA